MNDDAANCRSDVDLKSTIVSVWKPAKRTAAYYVAIGCAAQYTADRVNVDLRTVQRWIAEPAFDAYVQDVRQYALKQIQPAIMANVHLALEVQAQVMRGELNANDPRWAVADKMLYRFVDRIVAVEPAQLSLSGPRTTVAVTVNQPASRSGRILPPDLDTTDPTDDSPSG